jgi:hypothetical protein
LGSISVKPISNVNTGKTAPWFGQRGQGTQHKLPMKVKDLESKGFIKKIDK